MTIVFFTNSLPSSIADTLICNGVIVYEALAISEVMHLTETLPINIVVIDSNVEENRANVIQQKCPTLYLKPEAGTSEVLFELSHLVPLSIQ